MILERRRCASSISGRYTRKCLEIFGGIHVMRTMSLGRDFFYTERSNDGHLLAAMLLIGAISGSGGETLLTSSDSLETLRTCRHGTGGATLRLTYAANLGSVVAVAKHMCHICCPCCVCPCIATRTTPPSCSNPTFGEYLKIQAAFPQLKRPSQPAG